MTTDPPLIRGFSDTFVTPLIRRWWVGLGLGVGIGLGLGLVTAPRAHKATER